MTYWNPRTNAPLRTCAGTGCERTQHDGERFPSAPWKLVKVEDKTAQTCESFAGRVTA